MPVKDIRDKQSGCWPLKRPKLSEKRPKGRPVLDLLRIDDRAVVKASGIAEAFNAEDISGPVAEAKNPSRVAKAIKTVAEDGFNPLTRIAKGAPARSLR